MNKPSFFRKGIICLIIGLLFLILFINTNSGNSNSNLPNLKPITPLKDYPLSITHQFGLTQTYNNYVFSGSIYNASDNSILIETLYFTFEYNGTTYRTDGYLNITIPANSEYNFREEKSYFFYGAFYETDYKYVKVKINGEYQYLMHSNYSVIENEYQQYVQNENEKYEKRKETQKTISIFTIIVAISLISYSIYNLITSYIQYKKYYEGE